ncbi:MAG: hypothetical protein IKZ99_08265 [Salinivirgaceae bacterium]|nr:hypothetical protein [Salinivirgaceae bacterium]
MIINTLIYQNQARLGYWSCSFLILQFSVNATNCKENKPIFGSLFLHQPFAHVPNIAIFSPKTDFAVGLQKIAIDAT